MLLKTLGKIFLYVGQKSGRAVGTTSLGLGEDQLEQFLDTGNSGSIYEFEVESVPLGEDLAVETASVSLQFKKDADRNFYLALITVGSLLTTAYINRLVKDYARQVRIIQESGEQAERLRKLELLREGVDAEILNTQETLDFYRSVGFDDFSEGQELIRVQTQQLDDLRELKTLGTAEELEDFLKAQKLVGAGADDIRMAQIAAEAKKANTAKWAKLSKLVGPIDIGLLLGTGVLALIYGEEEEQIILDGISKIFEPFNGLVFSWDGKFTDYYNITLPTDITTIGLSVIFKETAQDVAEALELEVPTDLRTVIFGALALLSDWFIIVIDDVIISGADYVFDSTEPLDLSERFPELTTENLIDSNIAFYAFEFWFGAIVLKSIYRYYAQPLWRMFQAANV